MSLEAHPNSAPKPNTKPEPLPPVERYRSFADSLRVLSSITPNDTRLAPLEQQRRELQAAVRQVGPKAAGAAGLQNRLEQAERSLLEVDASVSPQLLRRALDPHALSAPTLMRFAGLLARHLDESAHRQDRFEYVVGCLLTMDVGGGCRAMLPEDEVGPILEHLCASTAEGDQSRAAALTFLGNATKRLESFRRIDDLFESGFYLDVYGYKYALRTALTDREILFASVHLSLTITNRLAELRDQEGMDRSTLDARVAAEEQRMHEIFRQAGKLDDQAARASRSTTPPRPSGAPGPGGRRSKAPPKKSVPTLAGPGSPTRMAPAQGPMRWIIAIAVVALSCFGGLQVITAIQEDAELIPVDGSTLAGLSAALDDGALAAGKDGIVFVGQVSPSRWLLLSRLERRREAYQILDQLHLLDVTAAIITREGHLVIQIDQSQVIYVE